MRKFVFATLVATTLSACGGSGANAPTVTAREPALAPTSSSTAPAPTPPPALTPIVKIDVFGDDVAMGLSGYGFGMPTMIEPSSASLQDALQKRFNDTGVKVANHATGGRAASLMNLLDGMDGGGPPFAQRLATTQSSIVIISYGLNEQYGGESIANFSGYLAQAIQTVRDAGRRPVLETPSPTCDSEHPFTADYAAVIKAVGIAYGVPVVDNYSVISSLADWKSHMDSTCTLPDEALYLLISQKELAVIGPLAQSIVTSQTIISQ